MRETIGTTTQRDRWILLVWFIFFFLSPYSVSSAFQHVTVVPTSVILTLSFLFALVIYMKFRPEARVFQAFDRSNQELWLLVAFVVPLLTASLAGAYNLTVILSAEYQQYFFQSLPRRVINLSLILLVFWISVKLIRLFTTHQLLFLTRAYVLSVIVIAWVGLWQLGHFLFGFPMVNLSTRSFVHSVTSEVMFNFRLTSIVDEPSYLVPLLIDGLIIGFVVYRDKWRYLGELALPCMVVLLFSYSLSGYVNVAMLVGVLIILFLFQGKGGRPKRYLIFMYGGILTLLLIVFAREFIMDLLMPVIGRFETVFDLHRHSRLYMLVMPIIWLFDYSWINSLFGFGPGSYQFLADTKFLHHQGRLSVTSNNVFIDLLYEHGIFGFAAFLLVYLKILVTLYKKRFDDRYYMYALLLWFHLGITSLYRSDFASPRFWVIILICFIFIELAKRNRHVLKNLE
ncbi:O-antigen ligase family protein [Alkalihalophilus sp. As8PL]|uniref:O-antigen ligase family protein n=1 Tax=Alkalihalophilus sp. As8PL TaxID=3237103 RepID=A0AB39BPP0_9BACI